MIDLTTVRPSYSHTREDSALTPCADCAAIAALLEEVERLRAMVAEYAETLARTRQESRARESEQEIDRAHLREHVAKLKALLGRVEAYGVDRAMSQANDLDMAWVLRVAKFEAEVAAALGVSSPTEPPSSG